MANSSSDILQTLANSSMLKEVVDKLVSDKIEEMKRDGALEGVDGLGLRSERDKKLEVCTQPEVLPKRRLTHKRQTHIHFVFHKLVHKSFTSGNFLVSSTTTDWPSPATTNMVTIWIDGQSCEVWRPDWSDYEG